MKFKDYIASRLIGAKLHFQCDCIFPLDVEGTIVDYNIINEEIVFLVNVDGKIIRIGENHPKLFVNPML
jgi:hypothetical protein